MNKKEFVKLLASWFLYSVAMYISGLSLGVFFVVFILILIGMTIQLR